MTVPDVPAAHSLAALVQLLALAVLSGAAARGYRGGLAKQVIVASLLLWTTLCATAYALASVSLLGRPWLYAATSIGIAAALVPAFRVLVRRTMPSRPDVGEAVAPRADGADRGLLAASLAAAAAAAAGVLVIAVYWYPTNDDSLTYRFARVMFYLSQGNLRHFPTYDPRLVYYPLCSAFLYFLPGSWGLDARAFNVPGLVIWMMGGLAVLATCREIGCSRAAAWIAACLYLTAPAVLVSAASTNDDMIAGVPALCGILFALCWWRSRSLTDALLAGAGLGLSLGSKLHLLVYDLAGVVCALVVVAHPGLRTLARRTVADHWRHLFAASVVAAAFVLPALSINLLDGRSLLMPPGSGEFSPFDGIANNPFSWRVAGANVAIGLAQLFLGDLPNTLFFLSDAVRLRLLHAYDAVINRSLFWWLTPSIPYNIRYYTFLGVRSPLAGVASSEATVTLGLLPWLLPVAVWIGVRARQAGMGAWVSVCLAAALILRFVSFGIHFRFGEAAGIYGAFAMALAAPALGWTWDARKSASAPARGAVVLLWSAALLVNVAIGTDALVGNPARNLARVVATGFAETQRKRVSPELAAAMAAMDRVDFLYTHYELESFALMMAKMGGHYAMRLAPDADRARAELYSYPMNARHGNVPLLVADDAPGRLQRLGSYDGVGRELVFGTGALPAAGRDQPGGYVVLRLAFEPDAQAESVRGIGVVALVGASANDDFEYALSQITPDNGRRELLGWTSAGTLPHKLTAEIPRFGIPPAIVTRVSLAEPADQGFVVVQLRPRSRPTEVSETWVPLDPASDIIPPRASAPPYRLATVLDFRTGNVDPYLGPGWSSAEAAGTWSVGSDSLLDLRLATVPTQPLRLTARVAPFLAPGRGREAVTVKANGVEVATWSFERDGWATMTADIPIAALAGQPTLTLAFASDKAASPASLGLGADSRPLKLLFETASLEERRAPAVYAPGETISFAATGDGGAFTGDGWSTPEAAGTWSVGKVSSLRLALRPAPAGPLHLAARVLPFVPPGGAVSIDVSAHGRHVATWTFPAAGWADVAATIPADTLQADGTLDLTFTAASTVSPAASGVSTDTRELKLMFQHLSLSE